MTGSLTRKGIRLIQGASLAPLIAVYQPPSRVKGFASPDDGTLDPRRNPAGIREMRGSANHKLRRKEVISMQFIQFMQWEKDEVPEPIQELMKQRDELR